MLACPTWWMFGQASSGEFRHFCLKIDQAEVVSGYVHTFHQQLTSKSPYTSPPFFTRPRSPLLSDDPASESEGVDEQKEDSLPFHLICLSLKIQDALYTRSQQRHVSLMKNGVSHMQEVDI